MQWRCSPVGLERPAHTRQVEGSSPSAATKNNVVLGPLVQWLEPPSHKRVVVGSSPTGSTIKFTLCRNTQAAEGDGLENH